MKDPLYLYCHTICMNIPPLPLNVFQLMRMYLDNPILCAALLTLTMLSPWRSSPAPLWLVCNKASVGEVRHCTARWLKDYSRTLLLKIFWVISRILICRYPFPPPLGVEANNAYHKLYGTDLFCTSHPPSKWLRNIFLMWLKIDCKVGYKIYWVAWNEGGWYRKAVNTEAQFNCIFN